MGMPARHYYTVADLLAMPDDGNKYELVHGELLVSPSPRMLHQRMVGRLLWLITGYLRRFPIGEAHPGGDVQDGDDSLVIPDLLVIDLEDARTLDWARIKTPLLVVEIVSPSHERQDRFTKRRLYQELGVPLYWIVDGEAEVVEVWTPSAAFPVTEQAELSWHPTGASEPLVIPLEELFQKV